MTDAPASRAALDVRQMRPSLLARLLNSTPLGEVIGERQLRRLFRRHLGAAPVSVAQTRRVLLAKALIHQTDLSMAQVALAWLLSKPVVTAPIVGATKPHHLQDAVAALDLTLTADEIAALEDPYVPQDNYWW